MHGHTKFSTRFPGRNLGASLLLHLLCGLVLMLLPAPPVPDLPIEDSISVTLLAPEIPQPAKPVRPDAPQPAVARSASPAVPSSVPELPPVQALPPADDRPVAPGLMRARQLFAQKILADPRSKKVVAALNSLSPDEQVTQLCNLEAMEQVHRWKASFQPDNLVASAMADAEVSGHVIAVEGGAFRSDRRWYQIRFRCAVTADLKRVATFEFTVGTEIPKSEWSAHFLTADDGPAE